MILEHSAIRLRINLLISREASVCLPGSLLRGIMGNVKSVLTTSLRAALLVGLLVSFLPAAGSDSEYRWRILPTIGGDEVNLTLIRREGFVTTSHTNTVPLPSLQGLERSDFLGAAVSFRMHRDPGTLYFKGSFTLGVGSGPVTFQPDPHFAAELKEIGFRNVHEDQLFDLAMDNFRISTARDLRAACDCVETLDDVVDLNNHGVDGHYLRQVTRLFPQRLRVEEVTQMKDHGVEISMLEALRSGGYRLPPSSVIELHDHGVSPSFIREMSGQYKGATDAHDLVALHDHGVPPDLVRHLQESGVKASTDEIIQLHEHGTDAGLVRAAKDAGLDGSPASVIALHDHGVDPQYVRDMSEALREKLSANDLIRLHEHGVSPDFARRIADSGFELHDPDKLINLHEHGVPAELVAQSARSHRVTFSTDEIIRLHDHGVDAGFLRAFDEAGYTSASADDLIQLHEHGVTPDYARRLQSEGFGTLSVSQLIKMKDHGV